MIINAGPYRRKRLPELDSSYPQDISETVSFPYIGTEKIFQVVIAKEGKPKKYTYQWYVNGTAVANSNSATFTYTVKTNGTFKIYCEVTNEVGTVTSRVASVTGKAAKQYLYSSGNQYTDATGGWSAINSGAADDADYYGAAELRTDRMWMSAKKSQCYGGRCVTKQAIDLTNYSTLNFTCYAYGKITVAIGRDQTESGLITIKQNTYNQYPGYNGTMSIDVSGRTDKCYILCLGGPSQKSDDYAEAMAVWLE